MSYACHVHAVDFQPKEFAAGGQNQQKFHILKTLDMIKSTLRH